MIADSRHRGHNSPSGQGACVMPSSRRRVVITGMGALNPLGNTLEAIFGAAVAGRSGVGPITRFNASTFPTRFAAEVKDFDLGRFISNANSYRLCGLNTRFALAAASLALGESGLTPGTNVDPTRFGVYLGTGEGTQDPDLILGSVAQAYRAEQGMIDKRAWAEEVCATHERQ